MRNKRTPKALLSPPLTTREQETVKHYLRGRAIHLFNGRFAAAQMMQIEPDNNAHANLYAYYVNAMSCVNDLIANVCKSYPNPDITPE